MTDDFWRFLDTDPIVDVIGAMVMVIFLAWSLGRGVRP